MNGSRIHAVWSSVRAQGSWRLALFGLIAPASVVLGFLWPTAAQARDLLQNFGYFTMLATFGWWIGALVRLARAEPSFRRARSWQAFKLHRAAWVLTGLFLTVSWMAIPYSYKVLYDEMVLQSTAFNLHFFRELGTLVRGHEVEGVYRSLDIYLDKRPFFYPFIVSLVHDLTGYRVANAFGVNTALLTVVLGLIYTLARRFGGIGPSLAALACFGASPLLAQNANGTGMEMLNLAMFLTTLGLAIYYLDRPDEARLSALVLSCVLLAQTRYESAVYVFCAALVVAEGWRRAGRVILPPAALCAPLLLVPCALHNTYLSGTPVLWELRADTAARFEAHYVPGNLWHALKYFFGIAPDVLNAWWLSVTGTLAVMGSVVLTWRRRREWRTVPTPVLGAVIFSIGVLGGLGVLMFYFWGQLDDPMVSRLALPAYAILALAVSAALQQIPQSWRTSLCNWIVAIALISYLALGMKSAEHHTGLTQLSTEIVWEEDWIARNFAGSRLLISNKTGLYSVIKRQSALTIAMARTKADKIRFHMNAGTFRDVLVTQYYRPVGPEGGFVLDGNDRLPAAFVLEPLIERQIGARLLRISRVTEINLPAARSDFEIEAEFDEAIEALADEGGPAPAPAVSEPAAASTVR